MSAPPGGIGRIQDLTFDCLDMFAVAQFWAQVLGYVEDPNDPNDPGDPFVALIDPRGLHPGLLFQNVPEPKAVKNRLHLDVRPTELRETAVGQVVALGGTVVDDQRRPDGTGWVVMADPEGNELCIVRSAAERPEEPAPVSRGERPSPSLRTADERTMLTEMLEWYREGVLAKVVGLAQHHAVATPLRSASSIAGIVKHLALVEDHWFTVGFDGQPDLQPWASVDWDADPDWEFHSALDEPIDRTVALYERACERSRVVTDAHALDDVGADASRGEFSLRWMLLHLIEETSRHLGHLDVLRELLDGTTGE